MTTEDFAIKPAAVYEMCADLGLLHGLIAGPDAGFSDESTTQALREYFESGAER